MKTGIILLGISILGAYLFAYVSRKLDYSNPWWWGPTAIIFLLCLLVSFLTGLMTVIHGVI